MPKRELKHANREAIATATRGAHTPEEHAIEAAWRREGERTSHRRT